MVLDAKVPIGTLAADYFETKSDTVFEIGLTPNRIDAASHFGVARDLAAFLNLSEDLQLNLPSVSQFKVESTKLPIAVEVEDAALCPRYSGMTISNLKVGESPDWLKNALKAIGVKPINNVVDVTNYVLHEIGQPLHAFDAAKIEGNKIIVKTVENANKFTTLDEKERELSSADLMICNAKSPMCIAGVFGGINSGVSKSTTSIFLESAYFNPVSIRQTAKRHGLNTDASFRYERGTDPNITVYALKRAALLLKEVAGGELSSEIIDLYPNPIEDVIINISFDEINRLVGQQIDPSVVKTILENLEFKILHQTKTELRLQVPAYRVDVTRSVDVIEEILRIYGYNNVKLPNQIRASVTYREKLSDHRLEQVLADFLSSNGYAEIFNNSLTNPKHYKQQAQLVKMLNPLSKETEVMRKSLIFGGLETIAYNLNRKRNRLKLYEFGKVYSKNESESYQETKQLGIWICGNDLAESWQQKQQKVSFFNLKATVENLFQRLGIEGYSYESIKLGANEQDETLFASGMNLLKGEKILASLGRVHPSLIQNFDLSEEVFFAELNWSALTKMARKKVIQYQPSSKFPAVRRDLALLLDRDVAFSEVNQLAQQVEKRLLKEVNLFDVYEGKNMPEGKKSYGVSFLFQDQKKTLTDQQVDKIMERLIKSYTSELNAELR
tara:strand:+ start:4 stop:2013 length:2010 start_codon:yes stop_codon:yes gene_type:complete